MATAKQTSWETSRNGLIEQAQQRFLITTGQGMGLKFYDPKNNREITIHNVVGWINDQMTDGDHISALQAANTRWNSLLPGAIYRPNEPPVVKDEEGFCILNIWKEPTVKPIDHSADKFIEFLNFAFGKEAAQYILKWLAWQYQHPLDKPHTALYLYGAQGTGKGTLANIIEQVFGSSAVKRVAEQSKLTSMSAVDLWTRTLLVVEEVDVSPQDKLSNTIKSLTGTDTTDTDKKNEHFKYYEIPANLIMLSNNPPTLLDKDDRRFYVKQMNAQTDPKTYFNDFYDWLSTGGYEAVSWLLKTTDISDMTRGDRPPMTPEKAQACDLATKQDVLDVQHLIEAANGWVFTPNCFKDVCNGNRLAHIAPQVGLKMVNLCTLTGGRVSVRGITEAQAKRLFLIDGAEIYKDVDDKNKWKITKDGDTFPLADKLNKLDGTL